MKEQANRLANVLAGSASEGDVVALVKPASLETAVAYMAIFRMGAVALPMSSLFGPDALAFRLGHGDAKAVISSARTRRRSARRSATADVPSSSSASRGRRALLRRRAGGGRRRVRAGCHTEEDPAFLIYTSGTTGDPKGALHAHRIAYGQIPAFQAVYEFYPQPGDVFWSPADWAWIAGLMDILIPAWFYGLPVVVDLEGAFNAERAVWLMREFGVTLTLLPPTALRVIRAAGLPGGELRVARRAVGSRGPRRRLARLGAGVLRLHDQRGLRPDRVQRAHRELRQRLPGQAGRARAGPAGHDRGRRRRPGQSRRRPRRRDRRRPPPPLTLLEYWKNPEATKEKFIGDWLLTGDLGVQDEDGYFWFVSRKDDVIKSAGYRIGPGEIEGCLGAHDAVAMAAVIGVPDERKGQVPKAFVVLRAGVEPSDALAEELRQYVRTRLAPHEVPREVVFLDDLPKTTTGKIMRRSLRTDT